MDELINYIKAYIKNNDTQDITGDILQNVLIRMVNDMSSATDTIKTIQVGFDFAELDKYIPGSLEKQGLYRLVDNERGFVYGYMMCFPWMIGSNGYQLVFCSKIYNQQAGNINNPTIIWRAFTSVTPGEWKPLQSLFVSNDGNAPSTELDDTTFAPSMNYFKNNKTFVKWSGDIVSGNVISSSVGDDNAADIVFVENQNRFAYRIGSTYYDNWGSRDMFLINDTVKDNYYVTLNGVIYIKSTGGLIAMPSPVYIIPGDITQLSLSSGSSQQMTEILGDGATLRDAIQHNCIIKSGYVILQVESLDITSDEDFSIGLSFTYRKLTENKLTLTSCLLKYRLGAWFGVAGTEYKIELQIP